MSFILCSLPVLVPSSKSRRQSSCFDNFTKKSACNHRAKWLLGIIMVTIEIATVCLSNSKFIIQHLTLYRRHWAAAARDSGNRVCVLIDKIPGIRTWLNICYVEGEISSFCISNLSSIIYYELATLPKLMRLRFNIFNCGFVLSCLLYHLLSIRTRENDSIKCFASKVFSVERFESRKKTLAHFHCFEFNWG